MFIPFLALAMPVPIDLDRLGVGAARQLSGRPVVAEFLAVTPADHLPRLNVTTVGAAEQADGVTRGAVLRGKRLDVGDGKKLKVVGVLRVVEHRAAAVNGVVVPGWVEVRVEN